MFEPATHASNWPDGCAGHATSVAGAAPSACADDALLAPRRARTELAGAGRAPAAGRGGGRVLAGRHGRVRRRPHRARSANGPRGRGDGGHQRPDPGAGAVALAARTRPAPAVETRPGRDRRPERPSAAALGVAGLAGPVVLAVRRRAGRIGRGIGHRAARPIEVTCARRRGQAHDAANALPGGPRDRYRSGRRAAPRHAPRDIARRTPASTRRRSRARAARRPVLRCRPGAREASSSARR